MTPLTRISRTIKRGDLDRAEMLIAKYVDQTLARLGVQR